MAFIEWREIYEIGFTKIDEQHTKLISIINELYEARKSGTSQAIIEKTLDELVDYTHYHFSVEEELFTRYNYPQATEHKAEHDSFILHIKEFQKESKTGNIILSLKTLDFLKDWTITHILGTDKEFGDFVKNKELGI